MQQLWEYRFISVAWGDVVWIDDRGKSQRNKDWYVQWSSGPATVGMTKILDDQGAEGWELVGTVGTDGSSIKLFFKRPKASPD